MSNVTKQPNDLDLLWQTSPRWYARIVLSGHCETESQIVTVLLRNMTDEQVRQVMRAANLQPAGDEQ
jgi:hypothetical protein